MIRGGAMALAVLLSASTVWALEDSTASPSMAGEKSKIAPKRERNIGVRERPTVKQTARGKSKADRSGRVALQIPERMRAILERKIEKRIGRNIAEATQLRREAISLLVRFVAETPPEAREMPEALLRLGELEWEDARDRFLVEFKKWEATPNEERAQPPSPNFRKPRERFLKVLRDYKSFPKYDLALYVDGFLATEEGKHEEALDRFNKILKWFPESRFVPDAHMVRAEYEFTREFPNYESALSEYEKVLTFKDSDLYEIALFKSAWCLWRLGKSEEAARRFLLVFKSTEEVGAATGKRRADLDELQAEALRNLVAVFVEDEKNTAEDMHRFLVKAGGEQFAGRIVEALAEAFYDQAHYERGIEAYRLLLKLEPTKPDAYKWGLAVARGHSTMESWASLDKEYRSLIGRFAPPPGKPSAWSRVQAPPTLKAAETALERQLREDAIGLHAKAQADKTSRAQFEAASALYDAYLSRFAKRSEAYELYFNQAEINFHHLRNDLKAAEAYLSAVKLRPKGPLSRDALYNALAALETAREREFEQDKAAGKKHEETPIDKKLTEAMELYVATYPNDSVVPELLFRQGKLYYDYGVYDPAVRQWGLLLEKYPDSRFSVGAGELILDSFNKSEDFQNIEVWARRLKTAPAFQNPTQQKRLNTLIVQAVFKQGEQLSAAGKHANAAKAYLRAASEFPKEPRAAQAAVNAEVEARKAGDLVTLENAAAVLIRDHKGRKEAAEGIWIAATTYQSVGLFSKAADYHAVVADDFKTYEHHRAAAYNSVLLRTAVGEHDKAIASGEKYKRYYPRGDETDEVIFLMGKAHEKAQKWKDAAALYDRYSRTARSASSRIEALVRLATVSVELGDERGTKNALERAMTAYKTYKKSLTDDGKYFAAKARYMQGERVLAEFHKIKIEGDVEQLKNRLRQKSSLLKRAADAFLETAEVGVAEWTTAALYQIGFTYESFAKALLTSPPPSGMSPEQQEAYSMQIDEFVIPIEERSLEAYESGWEKAIELGIFNDWTAKMREALGRLNTELYPPLKEVGFALRSGSTSPLPSLIEGLRRTEDGRSQKYVVTKAEPKKAGGASSKPGSQKSGGSP